jgi:hypothetical protein
MQQLQLWVTDWFDWKACPEILLETFSNQNLPSADIIDWGVAQRINELSVSYDRTSREWFVKRFWDVFPSLIILGRMFWKASAILCQQWWFQCWNLAYCPEYVREVPRRSCICVRWKFFSVLRKMGWSFRSLMRREGSRMMERSSRHWVL